MKRNSTIQRKTYLVLGCKPWSHGTFDEVLRSLRVFLQHSGFCFEFSRAALYDGRIVADVKITRTNDTDKEKAR